MPAAVSIEKDVCAAILALGARPSNSALYPWEIDTRAGILRISFDQHDIFCCFDDEKAGHALTGNSNPWSGKWNFHPHIESHQDVTAAVANFVGQLELVLPQPERQGALCRP